MSTGTTDNVRNWSGAAIYVGDRGTTGPTDLTTPLDAGFLPVGILDEDNGVAENPARSVTHHFGYGVGEVRATVKGQMATLEWTCLESVPAAYDLANPGGAGTTTTGVTTRTRRHYTPNPKSFVLVKTDGTINSRLWVPKGEVVEAVKIEKDTDDGVQKYSYIANLYVYDTETLSYATEITNDPAADNS